MSKLTNDILCTKTVLDWVDEHEEEIYSDENFVEEHFDEFYDANSMIIESQVNEFVSKNNMINEGLFDDLEAQKENAVVSNVACKNNTIIPYIDAMIDDAASRGKLSGKIPGLKLLDVSNVTDFTAAFAFCNIPNADLSSWADKLKNAKNMEGMFYRSSFNNKSILGWRTPNCTKNLNMFMLCDFNYDIAEAGWVMGKDADGEPIPLPQVGQDAFVTVHRKHKQNAIAQAGGRYALDKLYDEANESFYAIKKREDFLK